jgi:serine protease Do
MPAMLSAQRPDRALLSSLVLVMMMLVSLVDTEPCRANPIGKLYDKINPSVVVIHTVERGRSKTNPNVSSTEIGLGSGVVISSDGLIMTAAHVVQVADAVEVKFLSGAIEDAEIVGVVAWADVALLKVKKVPDDLVVAPFGDSDRVSVGDQVFVIGAPRNLDHTLTVGYISGKRSSRFAGSPYAPEFLQTDAAINEGNSGGPMFNAQGQLVGIVSQYITVSGGSEGLGLSTAINVARELLIKAQPFWLGAELYMLHGHMAAAVNVPQKDALLIQRIAKGSPADQAGLKPGSIRIQTAEGPLLLGGDIVLSIGGVPVTDNLIVTERQMRDVPKGGSIQLEVLRKGRIIPIAIKKQ